MAVFQLPFAMSPRRPTDRTRPSTGFTYADWDLATAARRVREGLPATAMYQVRKRLDLTTRELSDIVQIPPRTLARRSEDDVLKPDESERVYRVARLVDIASRTLGSDEAARAWMREPNLALGDATPLEMASTQPGVTLVERVLAQIEHGLPV